MDEFTARLSGLDIPVGYVDILSGEWRPSAEHGERQACCDAIMGTESGEWYMYRHCLSARHVGHRHGLRGKALHEFADAAPALRFGAARRSGPACDDVELDELALDGPV